MPQWLYATEGRSFRFSNVAKIRRTQSHEVAFERPVGFARFIGRFTTREMERTERSHQTYMMFKGISHRIA